MWLSVLVAALVDLLVTGIMTFLCAVGENQSAETQDYCGSVLPNLALAGIPVAVLGAVLARSLRRDWPLVLGVSVALLLPVIVWILIP